MPAALTFEAVAAAYFALIGLVAAFTRAARARRVRVAILALAAAIGVLAARFLATDVRLWLGHLYLAAGYWIPALLVRRPRSAVGDAQRPPDPATAFEAWLVRCDRPWQRVIARCPPSALPLLELSYLLCYVLVPAAFLVVWLTDAVDNADRFWSAVLLAGFACYGTLPWLIARPPRTAGGLAPHGMARMNVYVLGRVSHGFNTFPSGHVAVSLAAALAVLTVSRPAGVAMILIAAAIAAGAVAGRYHYAIDVILGLIVGAAASMLV